jgi:uncharacterized iron-regulated membrane protein
MLSPVAIKLWAAVHKWTSLVCTLVILFLCLTGLALIFHDEINDLLGNELSPPPLSQSAASISLDGALQSAKARYPTEFIQFFIWDQRHPELIKVAMAPVANAGREQIHRLVVDTRTTKVLAEPGQDGAVMTFLLRLHRELFLGLAGYLFLGAMGLIFLAALVSGVVLYAPFMRKLDFGTIRKDKSPRAKWLDLHNLIGITTLAWVAVVAATGVVNTMALPAFDFWRSGELPRLLASYRDKSVPKALASVDAAVETARKALPEMNTASVIFPTSRFGSPRHYLIWTRGRTAVTSQLFTPVLIDVETGALISAHGLPLYLRILEISRPLHFGDYGGWPLKVIWALLDLMTIGVLASGLYLWLHRAKSPADNPLSETDQPPATLVSAKL